MKLIKTKFKDLKIYKLEKNLDHRGYLSETYSKKLIKGKDLIFDGKHWFLYFQGWSFFSNQVQLKGAPFS